MPNRIALWIVGIIILVAVVIQVWFLRNRDDFPLWMSLIVFVFLVYCVYVWLGYYQNIEYRHYYPFKME